MISRTFTSINNPSYPPSRPYIAPPEPTRAFVSSDMMSYLEGQIRRQYKIIGEHENQLKGTIDIDLIKRTLQSHLSSYQTSWNNSWRSWRLFKDSTRVSHMNNLRDRINSLSVTNIWELVEYLDQEFKYTERKNANHYRTMLTLMISDLKKLIEPTSREHLSHIIHAKVEIRWMISRQQGIEKYDEEYSKIRRHI